VPHSVSSLPPTHDCWPFKSVWQHPFGQFAGEQFTGTPWHWFGACAQTVNPSAGQFSHA